MIKTCLQCKKEFNTTRDSAKYCTQTCMGAAYKLAAAHDWPEYTCKRCGKLFTVAYGRKGPAAFCGKSCAGKYTRAALDRSGLEALKARALDFIATTFAQDARVVTCHEITAEFGVSYKTLIKAGFRMSEAAKELGIDWKYPSKFQACIRNILFDTFGKFNVEEEVRLPGLVSPLTGYALRLDFMIKTRSLAVECDGAQHAGVDNHFHRSADAADKAKAADLAKEVFTKQNGITLVRIPYSSRVSRAKVLTILAAR